MQKGKEDGGNGNNSSKGPFLDSQQHTISLDGSSDLSDEHFLQSVTEYCLTYCDTPKKLLWQLSPIFPGKLKVSARAEERDAVVRCSQIRGEIFICTRGALCF